MKYIVLFFRNRDSESFLLIITIRANRKRIQQIYRITYRNKKKQLLTFFKNVKMQPKN